MLCPEKARVRMERNMAINTDYPTLDLIVVVVANLLNLVLVGMFLARVHGPRILAFALGLGAVALAIPLLGIVVMNAVEARDWWAILLPCFAATFLVLTAVLDYVLHSDFRHTRFLWPYVALFYWSLMMLVGYAFLVGLNLGFITLGTYYACVAASLYEYSKLVRKTSKRCAAERPDEGLRKANDRATV
jgi:hypothetical protein